MHRGRFQKGFKAHIGFFIGQIRHRAHHHKRHFQLRTSLRNRRCFHFHHLHAGKIAADLRHFIAAVHKLIAAHNQAAAHGSAFKRSRRFGRHRD